MRRPFKGVNGDRYYSLEDIPEGAMFNDINLSETDFAELPKVLSTLMIKALSIYRCVRITSLEGLPKGLEKLDCGATGITSLKGLSEGLKELYCWSTGITSFEGLPRSVEKLSCWKTRITSLKGLPKGLKELDCSYTNITSLEWLPKGVEKLDCSSTLITSLKGLHEGLKELRCVNTNIVSLEGCPKSVEIIDCRKCCNIKYIPDYISDKAIIGLSKEEIAKCKANWKKEQERKKILERQKTEIMDRFMKIANASSCTHTRVGG